MRGMPKYRILDWDANFENYKSREYDRCNFVCMPNKQHGMGVTFILAQEDGDAIYGVWCLIVGACSQQRRPRSGWLTDDGTPAGRAWSVEDMALRWRRSIARIERCIRILTSPEVKWLYDAEPETNGANVPLHYPEGIRLIAGREEKRREEKEDSEMAEPSSPSVSIDFSALAYPTFPCSRGRRLGPQVWELTDAFVEELSAAYPDVNITGECRRAWEWVMCNLSRRKTANGMKDFLRRWVDRTSKGRSRFDRKPIHTPAEVWADPKRPYCPG